MKRSLIVLSLAWVCTSGAAGLPTTETLATPDAAMRKETAGVLRPEQINEIRRRRVSYSGSLVQAIKSHNPLQLINPFAPASAGSGEANTFLDPKTGAAAGYKFISISR
jgi:hypothetical protein